MSITEIGALWTGAIKRKVENSSTKRGIPKSWKCYIVKDYQMAVVLITFCSAENVSLIYQHSHHSGCPFLSTQVKMIYFEATNGFLLYQKLPLLKYVLVWLNCLTSQQNFKSLPFLLCIVPGHFSCGKKALTYRLRPIPWRSFSNIELSPPRGQILVNLHRSVLQLSGVFSHSLRVGSMPFLLDIKPVLILLSNVFKTLGSLHTGSWILIIPF